ncbi:hypothetical protein K466DRAFT_569508 [Polyporus arcularius HHB13444]|uniref:Uncharacterized protein n=1 Tax=Polyporus arcularius HHB13444 TaxID=1314778 RepID=A0A5C3P4G3_9APHY|nr:hypothetical protein K466DRAFT_569508 [Polyporus arcularius HHB13444]
MSTLNNNANRMRGKKTGTGLTSVHPNPPVVLVAATPISISDDDEIPVATEDEGTPTPVTPTNSMKRPGDNLPSLANGTSAISSGPTQAPHANTGAGAGGDDEGNIAAQEVQVNNPPSSPNLRPLQDPQMLAGLGDDDFDELPQPMFINPCVFIGPMNANRDVDEEIVHDTNRAIDADVAAMSTPLSSPIYVPSSSDSPAPVRGNLDALTQSDFVFGGTAPGDADSTNDFWHHFPTPLITNSNLPSALATPLVTTGTHNIAAATPSSLMGMPSTATGLLFGNPNHLLNGENIAPGRAPARTDGQDARGRGRENEQEEEAGLDVADAKQDSPRRRKEKTLGEVEIDPKVSEEDDGIVQEHSRESERVLQPVGYGRQPGWYSAGNELRPGRWEAERNSSDAAPSGEYNMSGSFPTPHAVTNSTRSAPSVFASGWRSASWYRSRRTTLMTVDDPSSDGEKNDDDASILTTSPLLQPSPTPGRGASRATGAATELMAQSVTATGRSRLQVIMEDDAERQGLGDERRYTRRSREETRRWAATVEDADDEDEEEEGELRYYDTTTRGRGRDQASSASARGRSPFDEGERGHAHRDGRSAQGQGGDWSPRFRADKSRNYGQDEDARRSGSGRATRSSRAMHHDNARGREYFRDESDQEGDVQMSYGRSRASSTSLYDRDRGGEVVMSATRTHATLDLDDNLPAALKAGGSDDEDFVDDSPTPIPQLGDPYVYRQDPENFLEGMARAWQRDVWTQAKKNVLLLNTYNPRYVFSHGANSETADAVRRKITLVTGENDFTVTAPFRTEGWTGKGPYLWAIVGLSTEGMELILRRRVWSYKEITFFPARRSLQISDWILALEGLLTDDIDEITRIVRSTLERPSVRAPIEDMLQSNPEYAGIPVKEALRRVMATLRITLYRLDNNSIVVNVFMHSPTQSVTAWRKWVAELRRLTFGNFDVSVAFPRRVTACSGCLGIDHLDHICPFVQMAGWNGPQAGENTYVGPGARNHQTQGRGRGGAIRGELGRQTRPGQERGRDGSATRSMRGGRGGHTSVHGGSNGRTAQNGNQSMRGRGGVPWADKRFFGRDFGSRGRGGGRF